MTTSYGPWIQAPDHEFDYYAAYSTGHALDPQTVDPEFARLPTSVPWGNWVGDPATDAGYWSGSGTGHFLYSDFRPRGGVTMGAGTPGFGVHVPNPDGSAYLTWDDGDYTTPTAMHAALQAVWADRWSHVKDWEEDGDPDDDSSIVRSFQTFAGGGGAEVYVDQDRPGDYGDYPWSGVTARVYANASIHYYAPDKAHLLAYQPDPGPMPTGATGIEWESPYAEVTGAKLYIKIGRLAGYSNEGPIVIGGEPPDGTGPGGGPVVGDTVGPDPGAMFLAAWGFRDYHYVGPGAGYGGSAYDFGSFPQLHARFTSNLAVLRRLPARPREHRYGNTYSLDPYWASPATFGELPVIYDGPAVLDDPIAIDVTDFLDPEDGNSLTMLVHMDIQRTGVLPPLYPEGYDIGKADQAWFTSTAGGWFQNALNNFNYGGTEVELPYMAWTLRPARYRWVYTGVVPNLEAGPSGGDANFV